jgi:Concanavalin A-like lectin/glucanases superfamily
MKSFRIFIVLGGFYFFVSTLGTSVSSCAKTTVHDTTTLIVHDTTVKTIKDTVTVNDSIWNITNGLVAYYNFNGGNLNDSSGHNNNIVFNNATQTFDRLGNANNAYLFDGTSSYMRVANSASINPNNITLFAIVKVNGFYTGSCHANTIINKGATDAVTGLYSLRFDDSSISGATSCSLMPDTVNEFFYGEYGDDIPVGVNAGAGWDSLKIQKGEWYSLAFTYDGHTAKFYLDGALVSSIPKTVPFNPNTSDLYFGKTESTIFPYYFKGVIDEIRIYNRVVDGSQIADLNILRKNYVRFGNKIIY